MKPPGPPPTPNVIKLLRGNPGRRPIRPEPQPQIPSDPPDPPPFLQGYACDEWHRLAPELHRLGLLTIVDVAPFAAYCQAYARWREAEEALARVAAKDPTGGGLLMRASSGPVPNPLLKMARLFAQDMVHFAAEFGLTPVARSRISAGVAHEPGKFDGLFGE
jgi:P27 family predicted phage terminase small subunit